MDLLALGFNDKSAYKNGFHFMRFIANNTYCFDNSGAVILQELQSVPVLL
jgi:hypothetical protein